MLASGVTPPWSWRMLGCLWLRARQEWFFLLPMSFQDSYFVREHEFQYSNIVRCLIIGSTSDEYHDSNPIGPNPICHGLSDVFWFVRWFRAWRVRGGALEEGVLFVEPLFCGAHDVRVLLVGPLFVLASNVLCGTSILCGIWSLDQTPHSIEVRALEARRGGAPRGEPTPSLSLRLASRRRWLGLLRRAFGDSGCSGRLQQRRQGPFRGPAKCVPRGPCGRRGLSK